jgi:hypothetical protein
MEEIQFLSAENNITSIDWRGTMKITLVSVSQDGGGGAMEVRILSLPRGPSPVVPRAPTNFQIYTVA